jgi:hypothetical protein
MRLPSKQLASQIVQNLGQYGTPLSRGVSYYNVGTESILDALDKHYLSSYLPEGGAAFKLVVGDYGSGKSHFLYCLRERAWAHRYAVSHVELESARVSIRRSKEGLRRGGKSADVARSEQRRL